MNICIKYILIFYSFNFFPLLGDPTSQSTAIKWKSEDNLLSRQLKRQQKNGGASSSSAGPSRKRPLEIRSFFTWFTDHGDPSSDDIAEVYITFNLLNFFNNIYKSRIFIRESGIQSLL